MARQELHSDTLPKVEQKRPITDPSAYDGDIVRGERIGNADYLDELAFMEEPVKIRLEPSSDKNAPGAMPVWCNGRGAEILLNDKWCEATYLPVGQVLTTKRKYLEIIVRAKIDTIHTKVREMESERPNNVIERYTSPTTGFSVIEDRNPRGAAWMAELRRRNL